MSRSNTNTVLFSKSVEPSVTMTSNCHLDENDRAMIILPYEVETAISRILRHYWCAEAKAYARLPANEKPNHLFRSFQIVDDWLFKPYAVQVVDRPGNGDGHIQPL